MPSNAINGTCDEVVTGLQELAERTEANELFLYCSSYAIDERITSLELIAESWSLEPHRNLDITTVLQ